MWDALGDIARSEGVSINELITTISRKDLASSLTSAIRVFLVAYYRANSMRGAGEPADPSRTSDGDRGPH